MEEEEDHQPLELQEAEEVALVGLEPPKVVALVGQEALVAGAWAGQEAPVREVHREGACCSSEGHHPRRDPQELRLPRKR